MSVGLLGPKGLIWFEVVGEQAAQNNPPPEKGPTLSDQNHGITCGGRELVNVALRKLVAHVPSIVSEPDQVANQVVWNLRYSVDKGYFPTNLVDGDLETVAYPAYWVADYVVDLQSAHRIEVVVLVWGGYGQSDTYITSWMVYYDGESGYEGGTSSGKWELYDSGEFPNSGITTIDKRVTAGRFRIIAISADPETNRLCNWIGIQEFQACAGRIGE